MTTYYQLKYLSEALYYGNKGAGVLIIAKDSKKLLLGFRSKKVNEPNTWGVIGGKVDKDESFDIAAIREVKEETGYTGDIQINKACMFKDGKFEYQNFIGIVPKEFKPIPDEDHAWETEKFQWFTLDQFLKLDSKHFGVNYLIEQSKEQIEKIISEL